MNCKFVAGTIKVCLTSIIGIFLLSSFSGAAQPVDKEQELRDVQQIIAVVNDKPISLYDLKQRVLIFMITSGVRKLSSEEQQYMNQQAIQSLIDDKLKIQEAEKYKVVISKEDKEQSFNTYSQQFRITPTQLEEQFANVGIRKESVLQQIEASLAWENVVGGLLMPQVNISDEEIFITLDRMSSNKGQEEYNPREIFLLVSDNEKREESRAAALKIIEQLRNKAQFQVMARQFSQSNTSAVGGDLGWLMKSQLNHDIAAYVEKMNPGDISEPIETEDGFYIIQLMNKRQILTAKPTDAKVDLQHMFFEVSDKANSEELAALETSIGNAVSKIENCDNLEAKGKELGAKETGSLGSLTIAELPKSLHQPLVDLEVGHATKPIKEENGYRVFIVCGKTEPEIKMPDYDSVSATLSQQRVGLIARRHLRDLRRDAIIDYK